MTVIQPIVKPFLQNLDFYLLLLKNVNKKPEEQQSLKKRLGLIIHHLICYF